MKKQYVRYRLIAEASTTDQDKAQPAKGNEPKSAQQNASMKTALKLLWEASKVIGGATVEVTKLVFVSLKQMSGIILMWVTTFIKTIPSIATKTFNIVRTLVQKFWNIFGKNFFNMMFGLAGICATLIESISNLLVKTLRKVGSWKFESVRVPNFELSDRTIKILNEATNDNPGMIRRVISNVIKKAEPTCKKVYHICVDNNVVKTNPMLAGMVGISTTLICGHCNLYKNGNRTNQ